MEHLLSEAKVLSSIPIPKTNVPLKTEDLGVPFSCPILNKTPDAPSRNMATWGNTALPTHDCSYLPQGSDMAELIGLGAQDDGK